MPTPEQLRQAVDHYVETINGRDPVAIADLFTEDAVQADPASAPPNVGRPAITRFFADGIAASDGWTFRALTSTPAPPRSPSTSPSPSRWAGAPWGSAASRSSRSADDGRFSSAHAYWDDADVTFG